MLSVLILLGMMDKFIEERCVLELCTLKNGGIISGFHLQMVCKIYTQTSVPTREIGRKLFAQKLKDMRSSSSQPHHQQSSLLQNSTSTCERFSKEPMFIPIHIKKFFPNQNFKIKCFMFSVYKTCLLHRYT